MQQVRGALGDPRCGEEDLVWSATPDRLPTQSDSPGPLGRQSRWVVEAGGNG